ncbi:MAG: transcription elongation factor GreA [Gammaproteobacteria bacterium]|nr:transcription elongation factor GreA [Gammaproteobacteria bacterium]OUT97226.1 MAG: transcription elongation factor GreA [Gammaproteobacteria bacterium TMED36]|tara:strand:+ start:2132 stop:2608 length:477 start_codon:yes stop_codon:yes gene_type:complete
MDREIMTVRGAELLRKELKKLKSVDRPEIITAIATAREFGDLKENAEYHAAKEKQSFIEGRISEIESKLSNSEVIDITKLSISNKVVFGSTVTILNLDSNQIITYKIVGEDESDIENGLLSYKSPLSKAMIGKSADDLVQLKTSEMTQEFQVTNITYK